MGWDISNLQSLSAEALPSERRTMVFQIPCGIRRASASQIAESRLAARLIRGSGLGYHRRSDRASPEEESRPFRIRPD
ncbi:MAG: hypothetical protein CL908_12720 [Deltaproteobacteria bacterium]|nr:hypothetical protein [Deltaproteobacteria bacterium]